MFQKAPQVVVSWPWPSPPCSPYSSQASPLWTSKNSLPMPGRSEFPFLPGDSRQESEPHSSLSSGLAQTGISQPLLLISLYPKPPAPSSTSGPRTLLPLHSPTASPRQIAACSLCLGGRQCWGLHAVWLTEECVEQGSSLYVFVCVRE